MKITTRTQPSLSLRDNSDTLDKSNDIANPNRTPPRPSNRRVHFIRSRSTPNLRPSRPLPRSLEASASPPSPGSPTPSAKSSAPTSKRVVKPFSSPRGTPPRRAGSLPTVLRTHIHSPAPSPDLYSLSDDESCTAIQNFLAVADNNDSYEDEGSVDAMLNVFSSPDPLQSKVDDEADMKGSDPGVASSVPVVKPLARARVPLSPLNLPKTTEKISWKKRWPYALDEIFHFFVDVFFGAIQCSLSLMRKPMTLLAATFLASYLILAFASFIATSLRLPVYGVPMMSSFVSFCGPVEPEIQPDYPNLLKLQSKFDTILELSTGSNALVLDLSNCRSAIEDLSTLVSLSDLAPKQQLQKQLEIIISDAEEASDSLLELGAHVGGSVDNILAFLSHNRLTLPTQKAEAHLFPHFIAP